EQHCDDAQERKASHERCDPVEAAAKRAHQEPGDERAEARNDAGTAGAEADRGRADMGREEFGQVDRIAREYAEYEKAKDRQDPRVPGFEFGKDQIEDQAEDNSAGAVKHDRQPTADGVADEAKCNIAADPTEAPKHDAVTDKRLFCAISERIVGSQMFVVQIASEPSPNNTPTIVL